MLEWGGSALYVIQRHGYRRSYFGSSREVIYGLPKGRYENGGWEVMFPCRDVWFWRPFVASCLDWLILVLGFTCRSFLICGFEHLIYTPHSFKRSLEHHCPRSKCCYRLTFFSSYPLSMLLAKRSASHARSLSSNASIPLLPQANCNRLISIR